MSSNQWIPTSVSARDTYNTCAKKWFLKYRTDVPAISGDKKALHIGSWVHKCLELWYSKETSDEQKASWKEQPLQLVAKAINEVVKESEIKEKKPFTWEYGIQEEAIVFTCFLNLVDAMEELNVEVLKTEGVVRVENWFTGVVDVLARIKGTNHYLIIDYKNQAGYEELDNNIFDTQIRMYESIFDTLTEDIQGEKTLLGVIKLVAKKPTVKFRAKGKQDETFEEYRERAEASVQLLFVKADKSKAEEVASVHRDINKKLNTLLDISDYPCNRKNCIGKYGPCDFFEYCNPPSDADAGFSLIGKEIKLSKKIFGEIAKKLTTEIEYSGF